MDWEGSPVRISKNFWQQTKHARMFPDVLQALMQESVVAQYPRPRYHTAGKPTTNVYFENFTSHKDLNSKAQTLFL